ncbi:hypothetical protein NW062_01440 [Mycoplasmopsis cynos]|nr:hypothetical protein NW062_01440 [Mycoplasmopsis cynos]
MYGNQWQKIFSLIFTSFSSRSAGFATVDVSHFSRGSIMLITLMMIIGAACFNWSMELELRLLQF